jgi:hypothetical protein
MKKLLFLFIISSMALVSEGQETDSIAKPLNDNGQEIKQDTSQHKVLGDNPSIEKSGDTTKIRLGKKGITIIEKNGKTTVNIDNMDKSSSDKKSGGKHKDESEENENDDFDNFSWDKPKKHDFEPHYAGIEFFFNNYVDKNYNFPGKPDNRFMELNTGRSWAANINIAEYAFPVSMHSAFVTGLGFEINSYHFDNNNNIKKEPTTNAIIPKYLEDSSLTYETSKFGDTYINVPLLYEIQFPIGSKKKPLYFSAGIIGGIKISSTSKEIYYINGHERTIKNHDDFNLSLLRYGFHARVGYRIINLFATFYPTPLFEKNKGPELYPFHVGIVLLPF